MAQDLHEDFFTQYGKHFSIATIKKSPITPFKEHAQLPVITDILIRKEIHHVILNTHFSHKISIFFLEALLLHFADESASHPLRHAELIYLDIPDLIFTETQQKNIEKDFQDLQNVLEIKNKYLLIALTQTNLMLNESKLTHNGFLNKQLQRLLAHPKCRFIMLTTAHYLSNQLFNNLFAQLSIVPPIESDIMLILKQQRMELEDFHGVLIPEELLEYAYSLAERFLSTHHTLQHALQLLDSSAARAGTVEHADSSQFKPVLTSTTLINVLSGWTQIPVTHLQLSKFKINEFIQGMQQKIFGQDTAINIIGHELQQAQAHLQQHVGPFCSLLFAGPKHSGKKTMACCLAEQLFKQLNVLYFVQPAPPTLKSFADIKLQRCLDKHFVPLKEVIQQTPYAIILFEHVDQASALMLDGLHEILSTGSLYDQAGHHYNFRQAIIILSTTLGANRLTELTQSLSLKIEDETHDIDLIHLIMNEQKREASPIHYHSAQELIHETMAEITTVLPAWLCQYLHVVPFLPLSKTAIEKIIRLKLKLLGKVLEVKHGIEMGYAPEVIHYLADDINIKNKVAKHTADIDKALKHLYFVVEQAITNQADNKNRPRYLFLQLNETGQVLKCDWLTGTADLARWNINN